MLILGGMSWKTLTTYIKNLLQSFCCNQNSMCIYIYIFVCVHVYEKKKEQEREKEMEKGHSNKKENLEIKPLICG